MTLATRCPFCHTAFKVVQDQLKVSEGRVRCGRCHEVFNALEGLFDLERDGRTATPTRATAATSSGSAFADVPSRAGAQVAPAARPASVAGPAGADVADVTELEDALESRFFQPDRLIEPDTEFDSTQNAGDTTGEHAEEDSHFGEASQAPGFVRRAEREAHWRRPFVRAMLSLLALCLLAALGAQLTLHFRDRIAAHAPQTRPWLDEFCRLAQCEIAPWRNIQDVVIDSSSFTRPNGSEMYRFSVVLRNRAAVPLAMPWVELTLTDAEDQVVARRALSPADFRVGSDLAPGAEQALNLALAVPGLRVAGYRVLAFYP